jgi:uncharacterized protein YkwD
LSYEHVRRRTFPAAPLVRLSALGSAAALGATVLLAAPADAAPPTVGELRTAVVKATNAARAKADCKPLRYSVKLTRAAQRHAADMAANDYFEHTSLDGRTYDRRIRAAGYRRPGSENIARGYSSPTGVVRDWMASKGHRRNILDCSFTHIGVGTAGGYWVQDFGY